MRLLFISGREPTYPRNEVILEGLRQNNIEIIECTSNIKNYFLRNIIVIIKFIFSKREYDYNFVGFFGQPLVFFVKLISNKKILFDAFLSSYDTMCFDRREFGPNSIFGKFFYWLDKKSCSLADLVFLDTQQHIDYFVKTFHLPENKFHRIFVGANDKLFYPKLLYPRESNTSKKIVFWYGQYQRLHGIEIIVKAAKLLEKYSDIEFLLVGKGLIKNDICKLAKKLKLNNIKFIDWVDYQRIPDVIANSTICIGGHLGKTRKSGMVIAGKTYQFIAMKKPTVVSDNMANHELFKHKKDSYFCEAGNEKALANAILYLIRNKNKSRAIAENGYILYKKKCVPRVIGKEIINIIRKYEKNGMDSST